MFGGCALVSMYSNLQELLSKNSSKRQQKNDDVKLTRQDSMK